MEKFEFEEALKEEIRSRTLGEGFMKIVQSVRRNGKQFKISLRPVEIGGEKKFQAEMTDDGQVQVKNLSIDDAAHGLEEMIAQRGAREMHLMTAKGDLHIRVTRKGRVVVSRSAEMDRVVSIRPHDRVKNVPLSSFDSSVLLRALGIADGTGAVRASMRGKYDQVNEFLKVVGETVDRGKGRFTVVDCGCGKAYLTAGLYFYLSQVLGFENVCVVGVDRREDVIREATKMAKTHDVSDSLKFVQCDLTEFDIKSAIPDLVGPPDLVVSLHACDTATDEALAKAIEWNARYILSAPCCQHELQKTIGSRGNRLGSDADFAGLLRQGILRERLCDLLTDSFRALILRIMGYRTNVVEFVSPDATSRNILIKGKAGIAPGQIGPISEYLALRDYWKVTPWLETRLGSRLEKLLSR
ncbi:MAG: SAM-dependent methyltransferase [Kiritimatiellae bacterium]|nr:SAM-dependent methyltransferase [Kiritimatiellia bacterium]